MNAQAETTLIDPDESERELWAPGVGVVLEEGDDEKLRLIVSTLFPI